MRILGVDIGSWSIKAVEMEGRFRRYEILDLHEVRLPLQILDPTKAYQEAIKQLLARLPTHPEKIASSLLPAHSVIRFLPLPIKQLRKVEQSFRFELEDALPFKWEDSLVQHSIYKTPTGSLVAAGVALNKHIQTHIDWLKNIGLDPDWLTFDGMGILNVFLAYRAAQPPANPAQPVMLLDIGHHKTNLAVVEGNRIQFFRSIPWGGAAINHAISTGLGTSLEEAESLKIEKLDLKANVESASPAEQELMASALSSFSSFFADINQCLIAYRTQYGNQPELLVLCGGTSRLKGLPDFLEKKLGIASEVFSPMQGYKIKRAEEMPDPGRFGEALGRALVFNRKAALLFNFRSAEYSKTTSLDQIGKIVSNPFIRGGLGYAATIAALLFLHVNVVTPFTSKEAKVAVDEVRKEFGRTFPTVDTKTRNSLIANPRDLEKFITQKKKELQQKHQLLSRSGPSMLALIKTVSEVFPPDVKVDVNTLQIDDRSLLLEGVLYSGDLAKVTEGLNKGATFKSVALTKEGSKFTYKGEVVGR